MATKKYIKNNLKTIIKLSRRFLKAKKSSNFGLAIIGMSLAITEKLIREHLEHDKN
jgi:hypothetical protein